MKRLLLPAILVASFCASVSLMGAQQNYETNMKSIREGLTNMMVGLGETTIDKAQYQNALIVLEEVQQIVNFEAKNPQIVAKNIKAKLDDAIAAIKRILENLNNGSSTDERLKIAETGIKTLKTKLPGLRTGFTDIFKTPTDLKNAMYAVVVAFIATLEKFQKDAQQSGSVSVNPVNKVPTGLEMEVRKRGEVLKEKLNKLTTGRSFIQFNQEALIRPVYPLIENLRNAIVAWCNDKRVSSESYKKLVGFVDLIRESLGEAEAVRGKGEVEEKLVLRKLIEDSNAYIASLSTYAAEDGNEGIVFPATVVSAAHKVIFGAWYDWL
ncbi:TPA: hypothetical protein DDZ86_00925 [Candidatus Dependentiae bacterium]|nr:MAG: hypothetical protein UW09_C0004G0067 [candidate division TM6 bacterium GW2011_GWF2_43_87]HBL98188.1 hypothetical protein [Candidatus Dependentiae bacterium]